MNLLRMGNKLDVVSTIMKSNQLNKDVEIILKIKINIYKIR